MVGGEVQNVPLGALWLPPAAPVAQGANSYWPELTNWPPGTHKRTKRCQIAWNRDPLFAPNCDPRWRWGRSPYEACSYYAVGAVGKWPAGVTVKSLTQAGHLSTAVGRWAVCIEVSCDS